MLEAVPRRLFSNDYIIRTNDGTPLIELQHNWFHEKGQVVIEDTVCRVYREETAGAFMLEVDGEVWVRACKSSVWQRSFDIDYQGARYILKSKSLAPREFILRIDQDVIGTIQPKGSWSRKAVVNLPDLPLPVTTFFTWLVISTWQRNEVITGALAVSV
ncbi:MAG: hypothetical protein NVS2B12_08100 [Ktedonobacteraceae bacterium]